ncbi:MAG TPA: MFS transporter [Polyangiaceae bacterium]|nr:MFS transporter [Polyangiaceae bacterium]
MIAWSASLFFLWGIFLVLLGASHADVARDLSLGLRDWGLLSAALPLGAGVGVVAAGPLFDRLRRESLFAGACAFAGVMLFTVHHEMTLAGAMLRIAAAGAGAGAYNTIVNAALAERYRERSATPLIAVHSAATLGAVVGAPLVGWIGAATHWTVGFRLLAAGHLLLAAASLFLQLPKPSPPTERAVAFTTIAPYLCAAFAYVGIEATATAFAVPYAVEAAGLPAHRGRYAISAFWMGVLVSRLLVLLVRRRLGTGAFAIAGVLGTVSIVTGAVLETPAVEIYFAATGLAVGFAFPLLMTLIGARFTARGTAAGLAGGAGAAGGFVAPWLAGAIGEHAGVTIGVASLALWSAALAVAGALIRARVTQS